VKRREFTAMLGGTALAWSLAARAQQPAMLVVGFLGATTPSGASARTAAFVEQLRKLGWIDGQNITIQYRWAEGRADRAAEIAAEFVQLKVDIIVTSGVPAVLAAKRATSAIPIVFTVVADPVGNGLVTSLARPGGNITGLSNQSTDVAGKRLEILHEVVPGLRRLAIIADVANPDSVIELREVQMAAAKLGLEVIVLEIRQRDDIAPAFATLNGRAEALYITSDPLVNTNRAQIHTSAVAARLPTIYNAKEFVQEGGLMSYGPDFLDLSRRGAEYVDKILHGAKPAEIPVEQPTKFELIFNLTTAKALGITLPQTLLVAADEVIE
jgi:putative tryptophan/tyrosine transport system substrate-binding protein